MTPGCDSREDNNLSSDAEVPTLPAKTLPLSRSRSVMRDIVGTHQTFVFYSLIDVRDGFARDCPHTQSCRCSHFGIARGGSPISSLDSGDFSGHGRGAEEERYVRGEVEAGVRGIVSRAGFRGPGWGAA